MDVDLSQNFVHIENLNQFLTHTFMIPPLFYTKFPNVFEYVHSWNFCPVSLVYYSKSVPKLSIAA